MNRGIARRTVFENREDVRFFLSRMARCIRSGWIEVHAYSVLTTHFHLLARSPTGELAEAMQRMQNAYVRWFNRSRKRDGPLFRGRFRSHPVDSDTYSLIRYIDLNPVAARIVDAAPVYPYGSAYHYARVRGPIWLSRGEVERAVTGARREDGYDPRDYPLVFGGGLEEEDRAAIQRHISGNRVEPAMEDLVDTAATTVREWMLRKTHLADGTRPGRIWVSQARVHRELREERERDPGWLVPSGRVRRLGWPLLEAGLLRNACGLRLRDVAFLQDCSRSASQHRIRIHDRLMKEEASYGRVAARVLARAPRGRDD